MFAFVDMYNLKDEPKETVHFRALQLNMDLGHFHSFVLYY